MSAKALGQLMFDLNKNSTSKLVFSWMTSIYTGEVGATMAARCSSTRGRATNSVLSAGTYGILFTAHRVRLGSSLASLQRLESGMSANYQQPVARITGFQDVARRDQSEYPSISEAPPPPPPPLSSRTSPRRKIPPYTLCTELIFRTNQNREKLFQWQTAYDQVRWRIPPKAALPKWLVGGSINHQPRL